jgi:hypothetical protein
LIPLIFAVGTALAALASFKPQTIEFIHRHSPTTQKYLVETMGGGVAVFDFDNDGLLDILLINGGKLDSAGRTPTDFGRAEPEYWNRLYRQRPDGSFRDATVAAGLARSNNSYGMGVTVGDYDNDGFADVYVTNFGRNLMYRNNGNGTFDDVTDKAGVAGSGWSVSAAFLDYDKDGRLDLFVARYLDYDLRRKIRVLPA